MINCDFKKDIYQNIIVNKIKEIPSIRDVEIIAPVNQFETKVRELYNIEYPIYKEMTINNFDLKKFIEYININSEEIIWSYCLESKYWIKFKLINQPNFFNYIYDNGYLSNITIISLTDNKIYDIELGEKSYEIRMNTI